MVKDPVSFKKYSITANFFSAVNDLYYGDNGFGVIKGLNMSHSS